MPARNRKERRAAAASAATSEEFDPAAIPMARPSSANAFASQENVKTLLEIAAERHATSGKPQTEFIHVTPSGKILGTEKLASPSTSTESTTQSEDEATDDDAAIPPLPDTVFLSLPLSAVYFTLSFLAAHQYAQSIPVKQLLRDTTFIAFPVLTFLIHFAHGHIISFNSLDVLNRRLIPKDFSSTGQTISGRVSIVKSLFALTARNVIFCALAVTLGMRLIAMTNDGSYYAVMKRAPSVGTLWVWCVLELSVGPAMLGLLVPVVWAVGWKGYAML